MDIVQLRRDIHRHAEVGFTEFRTASKVVKILQDLGYEVLYGEDAIDPQSRRGVPAKEELDKAYERAIRDGANPQIVQKMKGGLTAVVGILEGKRSGPTVAFRFDMDALPITESSEADHLPYVQNFHSKYEGNMHACGHDAHVAIGLYLAKKMANRNFSGKLKLIFQPAEEGGRGAYAVVQKGVVDDVDKIYCSHLGVGAPLGEIYGGSTDWLASTKYRVYFHGVPSHSGMLPEKGNNALLGAATALLNIHAIPRFSSATTRVNVGVLEGGTGTNIVPHFAKMLVEMRAYTDEVNKELESRVENIIKSSAAMHELREEIVTIGASTTISCDKELMATVLEEAKHIDAFDTFKNYNRAGGSEDASFLIERVQHRGGKGTYFIIGTTIAAPHHHPKFDIDERILPTAVQLLERIARRELK